MFFYSFIHWCQAQNVTGPIRQTWPTLSGNLQFSRANTVWQLEMGLVPKREWVCRSQRSGGHSVEAREGLPEEEILPEGWGVSKANVLLSPWGRKDRPKAFSNDRPSGVWSLLSLFSLILLQHFQVLLIFFLWQGIKYIHHFNIILHKVYHLETKISDEILCKVGLSFL